MPLLPEINVGALKGDDPQVQVESIVKQLNEWGRLISNEDRTKIIKDDSGTQRFLQGYRQGAFNNNVGLKISQEGKDVLTATNDELVFNSDNNLFKIVDSATVVLTKAAGVTFQNFNYAHGLSYAPALLAFVLRPADGSFYTMPWIIPNVSTGVISVMIQPYVDATNVSFFYATPGSTTEDGPVTVKYYLLQETAS